MLLLLGDVEESAVRGMEQRDAQWEPDAHEKVLNIVGEDYWHGLPDWVHELGEDPVYVKENYGSKR